MNSSRPSRLVSAASVVAIAIDVGEQYAERCVDAPEDLRFDIFYGMSRNRYCWVDVSHAMDVLGYDPQDVGDDR